MPRMLLARYEQDAHKIIHMQEQRTKREGNGRKRKARTRPKVHRAWRKASTIQSPEMKQEAHSHMLPTVHTFAWTEFVMNKASNFSWIIIQETLCIKCIEAVFHAPAIVILATGEKKQTKLCTGLGRESFSRAIWGYCRIEKPDTLQSMEKQWRINHGDASLWAFNFSTPFFISSQWREIAWVGLKKINLFEK